MNKDAGAKRSFRYGEKIIVVFGELDRDSGIHQSRLVQIGQHDINTGGESMLDRIVSRHFVGEYLRHHETGLQIVHKLGGCIHRKELSMCCHQCIKVLLDEQRTLRIVRKK